MDRGVVLALARDALLTCIEGDTEKSYEVLQRIHDEHGPEAVGGAMLAWATTALKHAGVNYDSTKYRTIAFRNVVTGEHSLADETPAPVRWSGRFLLAVASRDDDQVAALMNSVVDEAQSTLNVVTLLSMCAIAINEGVELFQGTPEQLKGR